MTPLSLKLNEKCGDGGGKGSMVQMVASILSQWRGHRMPSAGGYAVTKCLSSLHASVLT